MSLATVIRLEFAYPGVGILAGDSLQYLSIATAHGVIMVFFMIMPAIFGAFGNFLLPTQLGVHDVAFPRLNSAAFWFLPGGLIMLFQLVCTDRRYARMNCFNIRELQGILKRKFFTDLVNSHEHKDLLDKSMIGLRYKTNSNINLDPDMFSFYNFGLHNTGLSKSFNFENHKVSSSSKVETTNELDSYFISLFLSSTSPISYGNIFYSFENTITNIFSIVFSFSPLSVVNFPGFNIFSKLSLVNLYFNPHTYYIFGSTGVSSMVGSKKNGPFYTVTDSTVTPEKLSYSENTSSQRFTRFSNPLINYDYKTGHYIGNWDKLYPSLVNSFIEVARGIRKPS
jgi:hypothetical protein